MYVQSATDVVLSVDPLMGDFKEDGMEQNTEILYVALAYVILSD